MADVETMPADRNLRGKRNYRRYETLFAKKDSEILQRPHMIEAVNLGLTGRMVCPVNVTTLHHEYAYISHVV